MTESPSTASTRAPRTSLTGAGSRRHAVKVRSLANIGGFRLPLIYVACRELQLAASSDRRAVTVEYSFVKIPESIDDAMVSETSCWWARCPQKDGLSGLVFTERIGVEVVVDTSGKRVGHHQRRRHEVISADIGVNAAFEVTIAAEHGDGDKTVIVNGLGNIDRQRAGVADARRAAVTDDVEAQLIEIGNSPALS